MTTLLLLLACAGPTTEGPEDTGPVEEADTSDPSACAPDHTWLPSEPEVVTAALASDYSFSAWQLDAWLSVNGLGWLAPVSHDVRSYRIRYTTQDRGVPVEASAVVSVPVLASESPRGTLLWTHPTSGFEDACAPSRAAAEALAPAIVSAARGYVVVAPDYLGLAGIGDAAPDPHPWIVSEPSAIASLDALRAADAWLPSSGEGARVDRAHIVYWGWSEGGFVALQADRWAPTWAPEHAPVGVVAAVPPVDVRGQVEAGAAAESPATAAGALMVYLAARWYGEDPADALLPAVVAALPSEMEASCASWPSVDAAPSAEAIFQPALLDALRAGADHEPWTCLLERSSLPAPAVPYAGSAPVLLVTAEADTLVPTAPTREAIPGMCAEGYALEHVDCAGVEHGDAPILTLPRQIEWIDARMRDEPADAGCAVGTPVECG